MKQVCLYVGETLTEQIQCMAGLYTCVENGQRRAN